MNMPPAALPVKYTTLGHHSSVIGLAPAFHMNCLLDLKDTFEKVKEETVKHNLCTVSEKEEEKEKGSEESNNPLVCRKHGDREFELYCCTCDAIICSHCVFRGEDHHSHSYRVIDEVFPELVEQITTSLDPMREKLDFITEELVRADKCRKEIVARQKALQEKIKRQVRDLHKTLEEREAVLISKLNDLSQKKLRGVSTVKDHLILSQGQIQTFLEFMKEKLAGESKAEILKRKTSLIRQTKELDRVFDSESVQLRTQVDVTYTGGPDLKNMCENFGKVVSSGLPCPENTQTTGKGLIESAVGELQMVMVQVINGKFRPCEEPMDSLQASPTSEINGKSQRTP